LVRRYWWVNQTANFDSEIARGRLWASANAAGTMIKGRREILEMAPGDLSFHYNRAALRATSVVVEGPVRTSRPVAYPKKNKHDPDRGWRVRVESAPLDRKVPGREVKDVIEPGSVLDKNGQVNRRYLFELTEAEARALAGLASATLAPEETLFGRPADEVVDNDDPTDGWRWSKYRLEQSALRRHLLADSDEGHCDLCGALYPVRLLVAAHIKPRRDCSESERRDFASTAMLLCTLGCDVLFEWGYVIVDGTGTIRPGVGTQHEPVRAAVRELQGRVCRRHDAMTASAFVARTLSVVRRPEP
jgi:hypothetical protein